MLRRFFVIGVALASLTTAAQGQGSSPMVDQEKAKGFTPLFDGRSLAGWRGYKTQTPPPGWKAVDGALVREAGGGDLMTVDQFADFELRLEWKISKGGIVSYRNIGIRRL